MAYRQFQSMFLQACKTNYMVQQILLCVKLVLVGIELLAKNNMALYMYMLLLTLIGYASLLYLYKSLFACSTTGTYISETRGCLNDTVGCTKPTM